MTDLWAYQAAAVPKLKAGNHMLAWEPGCGKTLPALVAAFDYQYPTLYLGTAGIREQVGEVASNVGFKRPQVILTEKDKLDPDADIVICSYDQASDLARWKDLMSRQWGPLILDEAHKLKTPSAKRTRAVYGARGNSKGALIRRAGVVWPLTGTPVLNDPTELWPHVSRLFPEILTKLEMTTAREWLYRFCKVDETPYGPRVIGGKNLAELNQLLRPFMSRMTLAEARPDMPRATIDQITIPPQHIDTTGIPPEALKALQAALDAGAEDLEEFAVPLATLRKRIGIAKAGHIAEMVKDELRGGLDKIMVLFIHTQVGQMLADQLKGFNPILIDGRTRSKELAKQAFISNPKARVVLGQITAMGEGLDGFQKVCHRVILCEYLWTPDLNKQAIARLDRAGQERPVRASFAVLKNSVDQDVMRANSRKSALVKAIMGDK
jgi:SWI/SNF-related matrix-associated actin-dependent regulator 1 of chromatin subfamily A